MNHSVSNMTRQNADIALQLRRIADAFEATQKGSQSNSSFVLNAKTLDEAPGFIYQARDDNLRPVTRLNALNPDLLHGIDIAKQQVMRNTRQFAAGHRANNILLWGQRGMGKSSLITAVIACLQAQSLFQRSLKLIQINHTDITQLSSLLNTLRPLHTYRIVLFCDDLKFDGQNAEAGALKTLLDGGLEPRPDHVIFYATSNHRHLVASDMAENEIEAKIHSHEVRDERLSLSDRFGISIGFHSCDQPTYLAMIDAYAQHFMNAAPSHELHQQAMAWAATRGHRSGRVAMQFITDYMARE